MADEVEAPSAEQQSAGKKGKVRLNFQAALNLFQVVIVLPSCLCSTAGRSHGTTMASSTGRSPSLRQKTILQACWRRAPLLCCSQSTEVSDCCERTQGFPGAKDNVLPESPVILACPGHIHTKEVLHASHSLCASYSHCVHSKSNPDGVGRLIAEAGSSPT